MKFLSSTYQQKFTNKKTLLILEYASLISVACFFLVGFSYMYKGYLTFADILFSILPISLCIILMYLYIIKFSHIYFMVPILFASRALLPFLFTVFQGIAYQNPFWLCFGALIHALPFAFAIISSIQGLSNKRFIIISMCIAIFFDLSSTMYYLASLLVLPKLIAMVCFDFTLLLFGLKNTSLEILTKPFNKLSPRRALRILKNHYEHGMISQEKYQELRTDIINK